ncbi:MAG: N-(5'-phosphoribosyl)anthranilate isomerase [Pseudomonadota bacterium]
MERLPDCITPERWLRQIYGARAAQAGGVVRRRVADVERIVGRKRFEADLRRRGFRAVENCGQFVIFCNRSPIRLVE